MKKAQSVTRPNFRHHSYGTLSHLMWPESENIISVFADDEPTMFYVFTRRTPSKRYAIPHKIFAFISISRNIGMIYDTSRTGLNICSDRELSRLDSLITSQCPKNLLRTLKLFTIYEWKSQCPRPDANIHILMRVSLHEKFRSLGRSGFAHAVVTLFTLPGPCEDSLFTPEVFLFANTLI